MTGYNMPPGVSPRDIPGNDVQDGPPEVEEIYDLLDRRDELVLKLGNPNEPVTPAVETGVDGLGRRIAEIVENLCNQVAQLTVERDRLKLYDCGCERVLDHWCPVHGEEGESR